MLGTGGPHPPRQARPSGPLRAVLFPIPLRRGEADFTTWRATRDRCPQASEIHLPPIPRVLRSLRPSADIFASRLPVLSFRRAHGRGLCERRLQSESELAPVCIRNKNEKGVQQWASSGPYSSALSLA